MKKEELFDLLGEIDEQKVTTAGKTMDIKKKLRPVWYKWGVIAACFCLILIAISGIQNVPESGTTIGKDDSLQESVDISDVNNRKMIGKISGAENEYITINDVKYVLDTNHDFSIADKGMYLGKVSNSKITMKVYSVKGDAKGDYIYALGDWEGAIYKKEN